MERGFRIKHNEGAWTYWKKEDGTNLAVAFTVALPQGCVILLERPWLDHVKPVVCAALTRAFKTSGSRSSIILRRIASAIVAKSVSSVEERGLVMVEAIELPP